MEELKGLSVEETKRVIFDELIMFQFDELDGNASGFQVYGAIGTEIKNNILKVWRKILKDNNPFAIYEIETPIINKSEILKRSGHVGMFHDYMVTNGKVTLRADHVIEDYIRENSNINIQINGATADDMCKFIKEYKLVDGDVKVIPRNLMFQIGDNYLRPEIAQSMFVEYKQLLRMNNGKLPFGVCQIGKSYRNEISCTPFTRLKEFTQAEIEFFYDPKDTMYTEMESVSIPLVSRDNSIRKINNYIKMFMILIQDFLVEIGMDINMTRFRQHGTTELAHYSADCWDLEIKIGDKWLECIGIADRGNYDIKSHIPELSDNAYVIEPSFGIDRLIFALLVTNFNKRINDEKRLVLTLNYNIAPYDVAIFKLSSKISDNQITTVLQICRMNNVKCYLDSSNTSIGKRYVRADTIGIPYALTIDFESEKDNTYTLRYRDTGKQIRSDIIELISVIKTSKKLNFEQFDSNIILNESIPRMSDQEQTVSANSSPNVTPASTTPTRRRCPLSKRNQWVVGSGVVVVVVGAVGYFAWKWFNNKS